MSKAAEKKAAGIHPDNAAAELARVRASLYRFLGGLYIMEVDGEQLAQLKKMIFPEVTGDSDADRDLREGYALLRGYLDDIPECDVEAGHDREEGTSEKRPAAQRVGKAGAAAEKTEIEEKLDDLAADYAKVFLAAGDAAGRAAFPYESVYVDRRHRVGGSTEMQMHALYRERGLMADPDVYRTMDDNIGLMLEYQAVICEEEADAFARGDTDGAEKLLAEQRDFLKKHLTNWAYTFTSDVIRFSERDFYKGVAKITSGFLKKEAEFLHTTSS